MIFLLVLLLSALLPAQVFEVASVKRGAPEAGFGGGCHGIDSVYPSEEAAAAPLLGRFVVTNARLGHLIFTAYKLHGMGLIEGGPDWVKLGEDRFTVEGKAEDPGKTTEGQLYQMLQALLSERFSLKFHRATKDVPGFALVVAKNGPKRGQGRRRYRGRRLRS